MKNLPKYSKSSVRTENPYCFLALNVFGECFRTIECYFKRDGNEEELKDGKKSLRWIKKMQGNFRILAGAAPMPIDEFHQLCIWKINDIRQKVINEQRTMEEKIK
jgi:hypothetical protein